MRCVIVDDSADFVDAARRLLEHDGITVVGAASTSAEALRCVQDLQPDVMLVDVDLGEENGFELAEQIHRSGLPALPPVIMISTHKRAGSHRLDRNQSGCRVRGEAGAERGCGP